jgi:hypothetical protein
MTDMYQSVVDKYKGSPSVVMLFLLSVAMLVIGINHFVEDTYSSYYGLKNLEAAYGLNVQIFDWSYWTMSLAPQIASMVFFYMYLSNTSVKWTLGLSFASQAMDFFADSWYRSNGHLFGGFEVFSISAVLTFIYFSIGSEFFVTVGGGLVLKLFAPALATWKAAMDNIRKARRGEYGGGGSRSSEPRPEPSSEQHSQPRSMSPAMMQRIPKGGGGGQRPPSGQPEQGGEPEFHPIGSGGNGSRGH